MDICGICLEELAFEVRTLCNHQFCFECLKSHTNIHGGNVLCPMCRAKLINSKPTANKFFDVGTGFRQYNYDNHTDESGWIGPIRYWRNEFMPTL
jgi:hypothetical protein